MTSVFSCKAQTVIYNMSTVTPEDITTGNFHIKDLDNHHDAIVGIWRWQNGDDSFEITFQEFEMYSYPEGSTRFSDAIFGKYIYTQQGIIIAHVALVETGADFKVALKYITPSEYTIWLKDTVSETAKRGQVYINLANHSNRGA